MKKLWGGRFKKEISKEVFEFTKSIPFDFVLLPYDVKGSIAHIQMLCKIGMITKKECSILLKAFQQILDDFDSGKLKITEDFEDVHSYVQFLMQEKVGNLAKKIHTARSRNDQVSLDVRLYCRDVLYGIIDSIKQVQKTVARLGLDNKDIIIPGFTHLQHAQPVLLAHHLHSYIEMLERDTLRFKSSLERINVLPLGSCALAGTSLGIDREFVAKKLGFNSVSKNSMDAVSDRDFIIEILSVCAITGMHLSRFCEDIILWNTQEFGWVVLDDSVSTGSSMMPNKKNPDVLELIRGKTGRLYGNLINTLTVMKSLPLAYNRDMQEDKEPLFDSIKTIEGSLNTLNIVLSLINFDREKIAKGLLDEELYATDIAEYLVKKGIAFRDAHEIVGKFISYAKQKNVKISELKPGELKKIHPKLDKDVIKLLNCEVSVDSKTSYGGTNRRMAIKNLEEV